MSVVAFRIIAIELYERGVSLRIPFRFGAVTVTQASQAFVRARIRVAAGGGPSGESEGAAAELMFPKWFDKSPEKSDEQNIAELRRSLAHAADAYTSGARSR